MSCELAKAGWRGLSDPYFGSSGLALRSSNGKTPPNYEKAVQELGTAYFAEESFKRFPGGIPNTPATIAGQKVRAMLIDKYKVSEIKKVEIGMSENSFAGYYAQPFTVVNQVNALFCYQFQACCALYHGTVKIEYIQTEYLEGNPELVELVQNSTLVFYKFADGEVKERGMRVRVTMEDGTVFEHTEPAASMHTYPTREFLIQKFMDQFNAFGKLPKSTAEKIIALALNIEKVSDMREYTSLLQI
jgi:2-methylcitrate dehydratase PrpD